MASSYTCPGCRQQFVVASADGRELAEVCPVPECRRVIWLASAPGGGFDLKTDHVPDLTVARFVVDQCRLLEHGILMLSGPTDRLDMLAVQLNEADPIEIDLPDIVRIFLQRHGRGCIFTPGHVLIQAGFAARDASKRT